MLRTILYRLSGIICDIAIFALILIAMLTVDLFLIAPHTGARHESNTVASLNKQWKNPDPLTPPDPIPTPEYGDTFATASIPRLGDDWEYSIKATTSLENLRTGIAWYSLTALPGETGNFSLAAHRDGSTAPFANIDTLHTCDTITINTQGGTYTYTVLPLNTDPSEIDAFTHCAPEATEHHPEIIDGTIPGQRIVEPTTVQVVNPTPGETSDVPATAAWLTLTSCHPHFSNAQRIIIHAILTQAHGRN